MRIAFHIFVESALALASCQLARSQTADAPATFEVATVRPSMPNEELFKLMAAGRESPAGILVHNNRVEIGRYTIGELICAAYSVKPYQIAGPEWLISEITPPGQIFNGHVFDVHALMPEGTSRSQLPGMLETLLRDRFGMMTHRDQREFRVYALRIAGGGANLKPGTTDITPPPSGTITAGLDNGEEQTVQRVAHGSIIWANGFGRMQQTSTRTGMHLEASDLTIDRLAQMITPYFDRPVINATGLSGGYQVTLDIGLVDLRALQATMRAAGSPCPPSGCPSSTTTLSDPAGRSLRDSIKTMGLRMSPEKHLLDVVVVDHIERIPTGN